MDRPEFHRLAEHELNEAAQYYDLEEPGLGSSFLEEVDRCLRFEGRFIVASSADFLTRSCIQ